MNNKKTIHIISGGTIDDHGRRHAQLYYREYWW
jgi:hypothetical protein